MRLVTLHEMGVDDAHMLIFVDDCSAVCMSIMEV